MIKKSTGTRPAIAETIITQIPCDGLIPLVRGGKSPATKGTWKRTFKPEEFPENCNYALRMGTKTKFGYVVCIDIDNSARWAFIAVKQRLKEIGIDSNTLTVETGSKGGYHLYFISQEDPVGLNTMDYELPALDKPITGETRYSNCYTVIPPSRIKNEYKIINPRNVEGFFEGLEFAKSLTKDQLLQIRDLLKSPDTHNTDKDPRDITHQKAERLSDNTYVLPILVNRCYLSEDYLYISDDLTLWEKLLKTFTPSYWSSDYRIQSTQLNLKKNFYCLFHKETHPSAKLYKASDRWLYKCFHGDTRAYDIVEIFHALKHHHEPRFLSPKSGDWVDGLKELGEWIDENNVKTGYGNKFDNWYKTFKSDLIKISKSEKGSFWKSILQVFDATMETASGFYNKGSLNFAATRRFISGKTGLPGKTTSRAFNFLVFSGILTKTKQKSFSSKSEPSIKRVTHLVKVNTSINVNDVYEAWVSLKNLGIASVDRFNKKSVEKHFGIEKANAIFKGNPNAKEEGVVNSNELEGGVIEESQEYKNIQQTERTYLLRGDTDRRTPSINRKLATWTSNSRRVGLGTSEEKRIYDGIQLPELILESETAVT